MNLYQKINYLLSAIRPERSLASVFSQIQTAQVRGTITFTQACEDLRYRCEALRADDLLAAANQPVKVRGLLAAADSPPASITDKLPAGLQNTVALISTAGKRQNRGNTKKNPHHVLFWAATRLPLATYAFASVATTSVLPGRLRP